MPILSRAIVGKAYTGDDNDFVEDFVQEIVVIDDEYETIVDEDFHIILEQNE
jgi:hypothetical protein